MTSKTNEKAPLAWGEGNPLSDKDLKGILEGYDSDSCPETIARAVEQAIARRLGIDIGSNW